LSTFRTAPEFPVKGTSISLKPRKFMAKSQATFMKKQLEKKQGKEKGR